MVICDDASPGRFANSFVGPLGRHIPSRKYALVDFSAAEVAFFQAVIGALGLFVVVSVQGGEAWAKLGDILHRPGSALLLGALSIAAPFMLISLGELTVPSGLAGVLASTRPMFIALFAPVLDHAMKINHRQGIGLVVGLLGVALVVGVHFIGPFSQFFLARWPFLARRPVARCLTSWSSYGTRIRVFRQALRASSRSASRPY